jgi:hypothetical protein
MLAIAKIDAIAQDEHLKELTIDLMCLVTMAHFGICNAIDY